MFGEPEDNFDVGPVPAVSDMVREEAPRMIVVLLGEQDAQTVVADGTGVVVVSPHEAEEERSGRGHHGDVRQGPPAVVVGQRVDRLQEEGVARDSAHCVVGNAGGDGAADPGRVSEKRVKAAVASLCWVSGARCYGIRSTYIVQIKVNSSKVMKHEVTNGIGALDGVRVAVEGLEEPRVFSSDKLSRLLVRPQLHPVSLCAHCLFLCVAYLVLVVGVQVQATLLRALPVLRYALVDVRLVDDLRYQLRLLVDCARVGRRQLPAEDGILTTGGDEQAEECPHAVHCEAQHDDGDEQEYGDASPHSDGCSLRASFPW
jgi:hypothetical protein